jgi:hypothetical protein
VVVDHSNDLLLVVDSGGATHEPKVVRENVCSVASAFDPVVDYQTENRLKSVIPAVIRELA